MSKSLKFSLVVPVFNVSEYLPQFIESVENQNFDTEEFEVIAVNDGSTDDSLDILNNWASTSSVRVKVISIANSGQSVARNQGLKFAKGEWVTFPDPDDDLDKNYLNSVQAFALANPNVEVIGTQVMLRNGRDPKLHKHPRHSQYLKGNRLVDLSSETDMFPISSTTAFFKLSKICEHKIQFDPRIKPIFEDVHFLIRYQILTMSSNLGICADSKYHYRKRIDNSSTMQLDYGDVRRFTDVFEFGFIDVCEFAMMKLGLVPSWLQQNLIYHLSWYLSESEKFAGRMSVPGSSRQEFLKFFRRLVKFFDRSEIEAFSLRGLSRDSIAILSFEYDREEHEGTNHYSIDKVSVAQNLQRVRFYFEGDEPSIEFFAKDKLFQPKYKKIRRVDLLDCHILNEVIAWVPIDKIQIKISGKSLEVREVVSAGNKPSNKQSIKQFNSFGVIALCKLAIAKTLKRLFQLKRTLVQVSTTPKLFNKWFKDSWILIDRLSDANDSAEHLFSYLIEHRPDLNAWFVIKEDSLSFQSLRRRYGRRVLKYGSIRWLIALRSAKYVISSHADVGMTKPKGYTKYFGSPGWGFIFLNHGVIKDDLSLWLNPKDCELFVTSTTGEQQSIAGDNTRYLYTNRESVLTGLPRFDILLEKSAQISVSEQNLILICPTWRDGFTKSDGKWPRTIEETFWTSSYYHNWRNFVISDDLKRAAIQSGSLVCFMPHPNLKSVLHELDLPTHVQILDYDEVDIQATFARAKLVVTDYSSVAFNAAFLNRPVVYFQFDSDEIFSGMHVGRKGYFNYENDGFGPVAQNLESAIELAANQILQGNQPLKIYQDRIDSAFTHRDGNSRLRVLEAIENLEVKAR